MERDCHLDDALQKGPMLCRGHSPHLFQRLVRVKVGTTVEQVKAVPVPRIGKDTKVAATLSGHNSLDEICGNEELRSAYFAVAFAARPSALWPEATPSSASLEKTTRRSGAGPM